MSKKADVPSFLTKRPAKHNNNNKNETVLHDHAASRLVKRGVKFCRILPGSFGSYCGSLHFFSMVALLTTYFNDSCWLLKKI